MLQPGQTLTFTELIAATGNNDTVELEATWNGCDSTTKRVQSANFYVSTTCEVADNMSDGFSKVPETNYTEALHASRVKGAEGMGYSNNGNNPKIIVVAPPTKEDTAYETDALLRQSPVNPILPTTAPYSGDGITLESFPSDEEVLSSLRSEGAKTIKLTVDADGKVDEAYAQDDISNPSLRLQNDWLEGVGTPTLTIKNVSKEYISCAPKKTGATPHKTASCR